MKAPKSAHESEKRRSLLDLDSGNRRGLERAMQHLLGHRASRSQPSSDPAVLKLLGALGFEVVSGDPPLLSHFLASGRVIALDLPASAVEAPEGAILEFVAMHFPEMEFYLPYITTRARYLAAQKRGRPALLEPEPDYDEDGFLHL